MNQSMTKSLVIGNTESRHFVKINEEVGEEDSQNNESDSNYGDGNYFDE
jgi:ubiquitin